MSDTRPKMGARKSNRGSSERFQFLRPSSTARNRQQQRSPLAHSDSDSDSEDGAGARGAPAASPRAGSPALPSFARPVAARDSRQRIIEQDAEDTIRVNSGNNLSDDDDDDDDDGDQGAVQHYSHKDSSDSDSDGPENRKDHERREDSEDRGVEHVAAPAARRRRSSGAVPPEANVGNQNYDGERSGSSSPEKSAKSSPSSAHRLSNPFNNNINNSIAEDEKDNDDGSSVSDEDKVDHFKRFFRRRSSTRRRSSHDSRPSGMRSVREEDEDAESGNGFLDKFLAYTGGGMTPGLTRAESQKSRPDRENVAGQENLEEPVEDSDIRETAEQILQSHGARFAEHGAQGHSGDAGNAGNAAAGAAGGRAGAGAGEARNSFLEVGSPSDGETMVNSAQEPFFAPRVGHYDDIDTSEAFDPLMEDESYIPPPMQVRGGVLGSLLKMYQNEDDLASRSQVSLDTTPEAWDYYGEDAPLSGTMSGVTATEPGKKSKKISFGGLGKKTQSMLSSEHLPNGGKLPNFKATRPKMKNVKSVAKHANKLRRKQAAEAKITVHIAALLQRQRFILRLCKAFMLYGAPTHRLEEYMIMTSRVLEIDGQFLYVPGCMVVSFGDATTRTSEVQLVRCAQGLNLWKLHQVHAIYKSVIHDLISAEDANVAIDRIMAEPNLYPPWMCVLLYGFCSSMVTPFAFGGYWINMATSFFIGCCVGCLQFIVSQRSNLYSNVFEVTASIVVSFCGRALGSIKNSDICFGATVQGSLALILPGFIILTGSLELQSRNLVAGSVRMFYAIIYSLFLGFGITLGAALFGWIYNKGDRQASDETTCNRKVSPWYYFIFVPFFSIGLGLINQAKWSQLPVMTLISCCGYGVTYASGLHFKNSTEFRSAMAAFVIGILGNLYSRIWKGLAVSAMLPAIFVQVPSGIASQSTLLAGVQSANEITNTNGTTTVVSGTSDISSSMSFGVTMIQVSIGISVGLFASTIFVYPFGKKKTGLFTL